MNDLANEPGKNEFLFDKQPVPSADMEMSDQRIPKLSDFGISQTLSETFATVPIIGTPV